MDYAALGRNIQRLEFDAVFRVADGGVVELPGEHAPSVYHDEDSDVTIDGDGWECITGMSGQWSYHGAVMHRSEFVGAAMAEEIARRADDDRGVMFAIVTVEVLPDDDDEEPEAAGWAVAYRIGKVTE